MTWPFENDTSAIVKQLAKKSIKANRRTSASIMTAILIASAFLCALLTFVQSYWVQAVQQEIYTSGDWDAQLLEVHAGQLNPIASGNNVKTIMVKGDNQTVLLPDDAELSYLLVQNCDAEYWNHMREKNLILEGRVPQAPGEIAVGQRFFEQNPSCQIGDTLNLPVGNRQTGNSALKFLSPVQQGESFIQTGTEEFTIVGKIDMSISTAYNGYPAYGCLNPANLPADTDVVVYLQMVHPSKVFDTIPQLAQTIGLQMDEYGDYPYRYHTALLGLYGIYAPGKFADSDLPKLFLALILIAAASIAVFAHIIRGAFSISAKQKVRELGILKSIGATPKQIRLLILCEARRLAVLPIFLSVGLGYLFSYGVLNAYSERTSEITGSSITVSFSLWSAAFAMVLSFLTVLLAASGPAKQMAKLRPIEAIREDWSIDPLRKSKKCFFSQKCFGFLGKLSANSISANQKLFRTCTSTLCLCMLLIFSFWAAFSVSDINNAKAEQDYHYNVNITLETGQPINPFLMKKLKTLPGVKEQAAYTMANCAIWISDCGLSADFLAAGGFETKKAGEYVLRRDGTYRIPCVLIGMEQDAYLAYLTESGMEVTGGGDAIVVNSVVKNPDARGYEAKKAQTTYLNVSPGQTLPITERFLDSVQGNYTFDLKVSHVSPVMPDIGRNISFYTLPVIVPMEKYYKIIQNFQEERAVYNYRTYINLLTDEGMDAQVQHKAVELCEAYLKSSDFYTSSKTERAIFRKQLTSAAMLILYSLTALLGTVGLSSAVSAIYNSLYQRRKEFAMLRSVGLGKRGLYRLLGTEAFLLAAKPIIIGLPVFLLICMVLLWMQDVTFSEFITVFPISGLGIYIVLVFIAVGGIYAAASGKIRKDNIVEVLRDENV
ncbi:MAG: ABC transporter permease [Lachnospiraceae bacterium]|nr:ABC transporter permease [Lachnospiraceae bacterium]